MSAIAVIGAGLSGLVVADALREKHDVVVFEKSRGVSGRMATRTVGAWSFDHGAQFFTARTPEFQAFLGPLVDAGVVADWHARFVEFDSGPTTPIRQWGDAHPHYVATPKMTSLCRRLANGIDIRLQTRVARLECIDSGWRLFDDMDRPLGRFDWVVCAAPAAQTAALMPAESKIATLAARTKMRGCFALLLGFDAPFDLGFDAAVVKNAIISWVSVNSSKPGRRGGMSIVVHSTNAWADRHIDDDVESLRPQLLQAASEVIGADAATAASIQVHRWRYANIDEQSEVPSQIDRDLHLAACGDWFVRGRVEAAFTSAHRVLEELDQAI